MKKHVEYWKKAIVNGKVHTAIKYKAVGRLGFNPKTNEETLLGQDESEKTHKAGKQRRTQRCSRLKT